MNRGRIDPGHAAPLPTGGTDAGAVGNGVREAECALEISKLVAAMLRACGVAVDLTRTGEPGPTSDERSRLLSVPDVDFSVSIHCNSVSDPTAQGVEIYVSATNEDSQRLGRLIGEAFIANVRGIPARNPVIRTKLTSAGEDWYYFIRFPTRAGIPAILVEVGFVSNPSDAAFLASFWGRFSIAFGITQGILAYLGLDSGTALQRKLAAAEARLTKIRAILA